MGTLVELAERHLDWPMPGYTHLQRAQPVYLSHHLLAYFWKFRRDLQRFTFCLAGHRRPAAGRGRAGRRELRHRPQVRGRASWASPASSPNSLDAVSNRDFVLDYLSAAATCATHLSQLGGEIVVWSSEEFGFCEVADRFASGSSLMPQKKNPDAAELLRAKAPRVAGPADHPPRRAPRPAADLQQGPPGGQGAALRRHRHRRAVPRGGRRDAGRHRVRPRGHGRRGRRRVPGRHRRRRPAGQARRALPPGPRHRGRGGPGRRGAGKALSELTARGAGRAGARAGRPRRFYALLGDGAWLESKVSEGGTALARVQRAAGQARAVLAE